MSSTPIISIQHVTKRFGGVTALSDVSLDIVPGEFHAIVGENGAGKSTLMKILSGVLTDFEGNYQLRGQEVHFRGTRDAEHAGVSIIHQELNLVEELSAAANIFLGRESRSRWGLLNQRGMDLAAEKLFGQLECAINPRQIVRTLRIGDQQLIEIAKALAFEAEILIMDEPTSALTETEVERLFRVISRLRQQGVTILYISHKMDEVFQLADRITVLRDGHWIETLRRQDTTRRQITHLMVGREIEETDLSKGRTPGEEILRVEGLSLPWPGHARRWRLQNINLTLRRGEILGIAGLMGAGRTELLECLFGASNHPSQGKIFLEGRQISLNHPADGLQAGIALVTEDRKRLGLFPHLNVGKNITICTLRQSCNAGLLLSGDEDTRASDIVTRLGIKTAGIKAPIFSLSGGNQQKAIIGRWLLTRPKVLLLDDPTGGIDIAAKAELYRLIDQLCRQGVGVIVTSSELPELLTICDRIIVLCEGRETGNFTRDQATEHAIMEAATARSLVG